MIIVSSPCRPKLNLARSSSSRRLVAIGRVAQIKVVNGTITIPNWEKHQSLDVAEKQREQSRVRMAKYRERQKSIAATETDVTQRYVTRHASVTQNHATEEDIEEDIDKNIKEIDKESFCVLH